MSRVVFVKRFSKKNKFIIKRLWLRNNGALIKSSTVLKNLTEAEADAHLKRNFNRQNK